MKKSMVILYVMVMVFGATQASALSFVGPSHYRGFNDSPFNNINFEYFYLEDFEDGALNTLGVAADAGHLHLNPNYRDSVDADDGLIDGSGSRGYSWYISLNSVTFNFSQTTLGSLPNHVGIVWTDVGSFSGGYGNVTFSALDADGSDLGSISAFLGDGFGQGQTDEDRFFGIINMGGISEITISMDSRGWEIDHLQYGFHAHSPVPVPEPATIYLVGTALFGMFAFGRKKFFKK